MADKEQVIQALRATLISVKGALTIKQCNRDYKELQGEWIPYKKLGYSTLDKLFQDVPGFKITQVNGEWVVDAIASQDTQHIASMVARQKTSKKQTLKLNYSNRFPKKQGSWRKPAPSSNYQSNYNKQYSNQYYQYNKQNKSNDTKTLAYTGKTPSKIIDYHEKGGVNITKTLNTTQLIRNTLPDENKHSIKKEKESEGRSIGKVSASQRLLNLRDRLNTVDLIPLQLPAHNDCLDTSQLITSMVPAHSLEPPPDSTSSIEKLEWTCRKLGLPQPVFKSCDLRPKHGPVTYDCNVKVGKYSAGSYPASSATEAGAREVAAAKLLAVIEGSDAGGLPTSPAERALRGLRDIVADHEAGIWASTVPHLYRVKYGENLPNNWLELVENCPHIVKDRVVNGLLVLLPNNEEVKLPLIETVTLDNTIDSELPPLQFPEKDFWNVFITVANSTLEVWLRIIGPQYSDAFEVLLADMAAYYDHGGTSVHKSMIIKNAWYAVNLDDGGWQRAKILEIDDEKATVFLGDHGDDDGVPFAKIKILEPQFRKLAAQAILCRLDGCEELAASDAGAALAARRLPGEVLVAAPGPRADPADPAVAVVLYDTSTSRDLNLNTELLHDFCIAGAFSVTQKPCEVKVGCVTDEGRVWVARAGGADAVRAALALLTAGPYRRPLPAAPHAPPAAPGALYIVRTLAGDWVRCAVISGLDGEGTVRTQLVDSGLILRAPLSSLVPLSSFSPALNAYPHQAMQVRLGTAERAAGSMVARLREMLLGVRVLCRAQPAPAGAPAAAGAPHVELFVRLGPQHILTSVNNSILMEYECLQLGKVQEEEGESESSKHLEALHRKKERIFRTASSGAGGGAGAGAGAGTSGAGGVPRSQPIDVLRSNHNRNATDIGSLSPPTVPFTMRTPPSARRRSASGSSPPPSLWQVSPTNNRSGTSPPLSMALKVSGEASPASLLRLKVHHDPPVYIPNLQEETILAEEHSKVFSQLNFVLMLAELLSDLAMSCGAPLAALMDTSDERCNESVRFGLLVQAMQALAAGLRLAAAHYRSRTLQPTPQVRNVVSLMNGKYKWILNESKRLHEARVTPAVCDKILYEHAIELCQMAAIEELFGDVKECERRYMSAQVLLHSLVQRHPLHPHHRTTLSKYRDAVQRRLNCLKGPRKIMDAKLETGIS